jgi:MYXO-CTERM domain-containing protein
MHAMPARRLSALATLVAAIAAIAAFARPAQAESFTFHQAGYADHATLSGQFAGSDLDGDGWLYGYELTAFELHWSGNRAVEAFNLGYGERAGLEFDLATRTIAHMAAFSEAGDGTRLFSFDSLGWPSYVIPGSVTDERLGLVSMSWEPINVSAVPEPQRLVLLAGGLALIGAWRQRRRDA